MRGGCLKISIMIVDDDPLILRSFREYFAATDDLQVVATARNGKEALSKLDVVDVDVVLADIYMPEMDGVTLLSAINSREHPPLFVAMTGLDSDRIMVKVVARGGVGYIVKSDPPGLITNAVRQAVAGGMVVSPTSLKRLREYIPSGIPDHTLDRAEMIRICGELSEAERNVLRHLCLGLSNVEIAKAMRYSEGTVKRHVTNLISYFNASSRAKLALLVVQSGLSRYF